MTTWNDWVSDLSVEENAQMLRYSVMIQEQKNNRVDAVKLAILSGQSVPGVANWRQTEGGTIAVTITGKTWPEIDIEDAMARGVVS